MEEAIVKTVPDFQKYMCFLLDEVCIKDCVYDKPSSQMINLSDINNQLLWLQWLQTSDPDTSLPPKVHGLFQSLEFSYVQFPCENLSGDISFPTCVGMYQVT